MGGGFSFDYKDFQFWERKVENFREKIEDFCDGFLKNMAQRVVSKTRKRTPVVTGALANSWKVGDVTGDGVDIYIGIVNGQEYASDVEYGHRIVRNGNEVGYAEGRFMLTNSLNEVGQQIPMRFDKAFQEWAWRLLEK